MKLSDRIDEIRIPINKGTLALSVVVLIIYSLGLVTVYELLFRVDTIKVNQDGSIEYRVNPR